MSECEHEKGLGYEGECVPCLKSRTAELEGIMSEALSNMEYYSASLGEYWLVADKDIQSMQAALQERGE